MPDLKDAGAHARDELAMHIAQGIEVQPSMVLSCTRVHPDTTSPYIRGVEGTDRSTQRSGRRGLLNPRSKSTALRTGAVVVVLAVVYAVDCFILEVDSAHAIMVRPRSLGRRRAVPTRMPCKSSTTSTM